MGTKLVKVKELVEEQNKIIRELTNKAISLYLQGYDKIAYFVGGFIMGYATGINVVKKLLEEQELR